MKPLVSKPILLLSACLLGTGISVSGRAEDVTEKGGGVARDYAVVVSKTTFNDEGWKKVVGSRFLN